jgi:prophage regulatory protein
VLRHHGSKKACKQDRKQAQKKRKDRKLRYCQIPLFIYIPRMRILSKKELRALVLYSPAHIDRLEKAGRFPKRVRLGPCRVGWIEEEVLDWLQRRIDLRDNV